MNYYEKKNKHTTLDDLIFNGDESSIRQLIAILTDNAVKYCDTDGEIEVSVKKLPLGQVISKPKGDKFINQRL